MPYWADLYKAWQNAAGTLDPIKRREVNKSVEGAAVLAVDAISDIRAGGESLGGSRGVIRLRDSNDFVDLSSITNRQSRYKEYERLRVVPEIENAITIFADESCVVGNTLVATPFGMIPIEELAKNKKPDEKFLVYCYDFLKKDYTLGWAYNPRKTKCAKTVIVTVDDGSQFECTADHRVLLSNGEWIEAGKLQEANEIMPFYREKAKTKNVRKQFPRIFTHNQGWIRERDFIDEWRIGKKIQSESTKKLYKIVRCISEGCSTKQVAEIMQTKWPSLDDRLEAGGFSYKELKKLATKPKSRRILGVWQSNEEKDVYDLSVDKHENFCTSIGVFHNCQIGENAHMFDIQVKNQDIKQELEFLFFHPSMINIDDNLWGWCRDLFLFGDLFMELVIDLEEPKLGVLKVQVLPPESVYRIETIKGKVIEFQQAKEGPDYQSLARVEVTKATEADLAQATALRFAPQSMIHFRIGGNRKTFYPYGVSLIEAARGPAHQLKLMEESMLIYRLCLKYDTRIRTNLGWKYIKDIKIGDNVYTCDKDNNVVESKVIDWFNSGIKEVFRIKSQHIDLYATSNHPILVNKDGVIQYVYAKDLRPKKDKLINVTHDIEIPVEIPRIFDEKRFTLTEKGKIQLKNKKLKRNDLIVYSDKRAVSQFLNKKGMTLCLEDGNRIKDQFNLSNDDYLYCNKSEINPERIKVPSVVDEDFARLFGFMLGDGFLANNQMGFAAGDDEETNQKYKKLLERYFGEPAFEHDNRLDNPYVGKWRVSSKIACQIYLAMGYIPNKYEKRIPGWAFNASKSIRRALVEGLSDADGCERYTKAGLWFSTIELCNLELIEDTKEIWHGIGLCSGIIGHRYRKGGHVIERKKNGEVRIMPDTECWSVTVTDRLLPKYENIWFVKPAGKEEVFDITVDHEEHNFIANGTASANSRAPERRVFYIDVGQLPPFKAEAFMTRLQDMFRKKKTFSTKGGPGGAGPVEERWQAQSADEDFWIPLRPNSNTRVETLPGACLALDTKIPLLDGRTLTLSEIIKEYKSGKQLWAYSCNPENGEPAPGKITWAGITRKNTQVVKVNFDNGESIVCTPDHKFPIIGKGKVEAKDLKIGESMIPFNTRMEDLHWNRPTKYRQIYNVLSKKWVFVHRMVASQYRQEMVWKEEYANSIKDVIHHKNFDHLDNNPENLFWMNWDDHVAYHRDHQEITNKNISKALKEYHSALSVEEQKNRNEILKSRSQNGVKALSDKLLDIEFNNEFRQKQKEGWKKAKEENPELHKARGEKISARNYEFWSNPENKKIVFEKQTIVYPKQILDFTIDQLAKDKTAEEIVLDIRSNKIFVELLESSNNHIIRDGVDFNNFSLDHLKKMLKQNGFKSVRSARQTVGGQEVKSGRPQTPFPKSVMNHFMLLLKDDKSISEILESINQNEKLMAEIKAIRPDLKNGFDRNLMNKMLKYFGYKGLNHAKEHVHEYNHKVVSVEWLEERMDTGTLTIDGDHELHNYHTFAIKDICYLFNSNLGEIDDALYFRNKLFISMCFPKNYMAQEDPSLTKVTLSSIDVKFARLIERLQRSIAAGLVDIAIRHLQLRGFPTTLYDDLQIKMTPPSHYRELSENEVKDARVQRLSTLKGTMVLSDFDLLVDMMHYPEEEAKEKVARSMIQKLQELKLQVMSQNPQLLGIAMPQPAPNEMGTNAQGPTPQQIPGQESQPTGEMEAEPGAEEEQGALDTYGKPPKPPQAIKLPEPTEEELRQYDLEIEDLSRFIDEEEVDLLELD